MNAIILLTLITLTLIVFFTLRKLIKSQAPNAPAVDFRPLALACGLAVVTILCTAASYVAQDVLANRFIIRKDGSLLGTNVTATMTNSVFTLQGSSSTFSVPATGIPTVDDKFGISVTLTNGTIGVTTQRMVFQRGILVTNTTGL
jgi:hypothetical protein